MTARIGDDMPQTPEALAARVRELEELLVSTGHQNDSLKAEVDGARQTVIELQRAERAHALQCPLAKRPGGAT